MSGNPFAKPSFAHRREWEEALLFFCLEQLRAPTLRDWLTFAEDGEAREAAGFLAHELANFAYVRGLGHEKALRGVSEALLAKTMTIDDFARWLSRGWIDHVRFFHALQQAASIDAARGSHALTA